MINRIYRLHSPRKIKLHIREENLSEDELIVRPTYLSICAADQRYYQGKRPEEILKKKLPLVLIHEAIGKIVYDPKGEFKTGTEVMMVPNLPIEENEEISENYLRSSKFRSSSIDGFMQEYVVQPRDRVVETPKNVPKEVLAFSELISVSLHAINRFEKKSNAIKERLGVWGDGNLGLITSLVLKKKFPNSKIIVFGKSKEKLNYFSFADETYLINEVDEKKIFINHAFECVGGLGSKFAINQAIDLISPEGSIMLLGVTEEKVDINTRMILEKGIILVGNSRSTLKDFYNTKEFLQSYPDVIGYLENLINSVVEINEIDDIEKAFEIDSIKKWGKTILKWNL